MADLKNYGIILASGTGSRYGSDIPKQFISLAGKTILEHTIEAFEKTEKIDHIIIVITPEYKYLAEKILLKNNFKKVIKLLCGGKTRKDSSYIGISSIKENEANILIHDCARPFIKKEIILNCIEALKKHDAVDVAIASSDTILKVKNGFIEEIPERSAFMRSQTPQCFKLSLIKKAHELSKNDQSYTDDCGLIVKYNLANIYIVEGDVENIKITYPSDIYMAEKILEMKNNPNY